LSDDGVIFISIDDHEIAPLTTLCDSIFGEENHIETVIWKNKYGAGAKTVGFISVHEYVLCYSKNPIKDLTSELDVEGQSAYKKKDEKFNVRGGYLTQPLMTTSLGDRPNLVYDIEYNGDIITPRKQWVWSKERLESAIYNNEVEFNKEKDGIYSVRAKKYLIDENGNMRRGKPLSIMNGPFTQDGTREIRQLFGSEDIFKFSKPSELIRYFIAFSINGMIKKDAVVLDFFSGSATTAHAVMQLNAEDGGHRKFIMVQLPEVCDEKSEAFKAGYKNICDIGEERIRRAGKKIKEDNPLTTKDLDIGFRVFNVDSTNMKDVYYTPGEYRQDDMFAFADNIKEDRTSEDLLFQVMLDLGILLSSKIEVQTIGGQKVFSVADGYLLACFDEEITDSTITEIAKKKPYYAIFRDSSIENDSVAANFEQIFAAYSPSTVRKVL
jgi:adenine-specific DNA-methyltransferase